MDTELGYRECLDLLAGSSVGRVAFCTPQGPSIVPVNYAVVDDSIVLRTTPYSALGTHGWNSRLAFEVDRLDAEQHVGWSVVARGRGEMVEDRTELGLIRGFHDPKPWAGGSRVLYLRLRWDELTGRRVVAGPVTMAPWQRTVTD
jgi:nitroimidazol reductase NimA-like FMN-containing flavoprotein (pyridoxamine 5'-phosphate oxidase superfamily)